MPWIHKKVFVQDEVLTMQDEIETLYDFPNFFAGAELDNNISLDLNFLSDDYVFSELRIRDLGLKGLKVSANLIVKGQFIRDEQDAIVGLSAKLLSRDIMLNSKKFMVARMSFKLTRNDLEIRSLRLGKSYELKGRVSLKEPFDTDLRLDIRRADIKDFLLLASKENLPVILGIMDGVFYIKGAAAANLFSNGILGSRNGKIGPIEYDVATVRFEGLGPIINIIDSSLRRDKGTLTVVGYIDLRKIAKGNMFEGLNVKSDMMAVVWDGWDIAGSKTDELSMIKDISDRMRVGFKTMARDPQITYYDRESPEEMSLDYKVGEGHLKLKLKENEEFFGLEHNVKF
ncbi:hypothetical protein ACFL0P_03090 [Candidatus Omnitrophota bacterium]